jgi:hypothetical protein
MVGMTVDDKVSDFPASCIVHIQIGSFHIVGQLVFEPDNFIGRIWKGFQQNIWLYAYGR